MTKQWKKVKEIVTDTDKGYKKLRTTFKGPAANVSAGWFQSSGVYKPKKGEKSKGITLAQIAAIHEFGSKDGTIPARHPLGNAVDTNEAQLKSLIKKLANRMIDGLDTPKTAAGKLGQKIVDFIRHGITKGLKPGLKPATLKRKGPGKSKPLIDTGQLLGAVSFQVRKGKK